MKAIDQYFPVALFIISESVDEILKCDHSKEYYRAALSGGALYYAVQVDCNF